jgi:peptide/histidine transporter 3/4
MISYTIICYICQYGIPELGGVEWGFFVGYMIPCIAMLIAIGVFVSGLPRYKQFPPQGSVVSRSLGILFQAAYRSLKSSIGRGNSKGIHFLEVAQVEYGGSYTAEEIGAVKLLVRLFPFLLVMIPFWNIYTQMSTAFQNQACQMDLSLGLGVNIPTSALNLFDSVIILMLVPVFDLWMFPSIKQYTGKPPTKLQKLGWGFLFALASMVVAALVEQGRFNMRPSAGNYFSETARANMSPCQDINDYNPYEYQMWLAGAVGCICNV